jgi:hypothetical protein
MDSRAFAPLPKEIMAKLVERDDANEIVKLLYNLGRTADWAQLGIDLTLVAGRDDDHHGEPIPFRARIYGDSVELPEHAPQDRLPPGEIHSSGPQQTILPFYQEFKRGETIRVKNRPQIIVGGRRLVYGGLPGEFVLRDILVGADSFWKGKGRKATPMEEFAPVPPKAREAILAGSPPSEIAHTIENAKIGTAAPSIEAALLVECVGKGGLFLSHLVGDMSL